MKSVPFSLLLLAAAMPASGQEAEPLGWEVKFPAPFVDRIPARPKPKVKPVDFTVLSSKTRRVEVTDAPEMAGLPPVTGTINLTMQRVAKPDLPELPKPLSALPVTDPAVIARLKAMRASHPRRELVFLSATVYDHKRTLLRIHPNGGVDQAVTAWSNLDFTRFSGFGSYQVTEADGTLRDVWLLMGISNTDTVRMAERLKLHKQNYVAPEIPAMADAVDGQGTFLIVEGDDASPAMKTLDELHELFRLEGDRMETAFHAREQATAEQFAYLLANPRTPEDVVIKYWPQTSRRHASNPAPAAR